MAVYKRAMSHSFRTALPFWMSLGLVPLAILAAVLGGWWWVLMPLYAWYLVTGLDLVFTAQNYHDLHLKPFAADTAARVNAAAYRALKPGGLYVVVDHAASSSG